MSEETLVNLGGQDWDDIVAAARHAEAGERIVVNMGPQHPSTHGVLRLILEIEGRNSHQRPVRNRLPAHRNRKRTWNSATGRRGVTFVTRMDYLSPFFNETAYCLGVEALLASRTQSRSAPV